jgi:hypothetical protein
MRVPLDGVERPLDQAGLRSPPSGIIQPGSFLSTYESEACRLHVPGMVEAPSYPSRIITFVKSYTIFLTSAIPKRDSLLNFGSPGRTWWSGVRCGCSLECIRRFAVRFNRNTTNIPALVREAISVKIMNSGAGGSTKIDNNAQGSNGWSFRSGPTLCYFEGAASVDPLVGAFTQHICNRTTLPVTFDGNYRNARL